MREHKARASGRTDLNQWINGQQTGGTNTKATEVLGTRVKPCCALLTYLPGRYLDPQ